MADKKPRKGDGWQPDEGSWAGSGGRKRRNRIDDMVDEAVSGEDNDKRHPSAKRYKGRPD